MEVFGELVYYHYYRSLQKRRINQSADAIGCH